MGASKKSQMKHLDTDWADQIWKAAKAKNGGKGAAYLLPIAALALTGARPISLERGITFSISEENGKVCIEATIPGAKIVLAEDGSVIRGQKEYKQRFDGNCARWQEIKEIAIAIRKAKGPITVQYDAEAISTRLRELSKSIWPRKKYQVTAYSYRELFASNAKGSGMAPHDIAAAMGHLSTESQGKYSPRDRKRTRGGAVKPCTSAKATEKIKTHRSPMSRFKNATRIKKLHI